MTDEIYAEVLAEPRRDYAATTDDLLALARHWAAVACDADLWLGRQTEPGWNPLLARLRRNAQAMHALERLIDALGRDEVARVMDAAEEDLKRRVGLERWQLLESGTWIQQHHVGQLQARECERLREKANDPAHADPAWERLRANPSGVFLDGTGDLWFFAALPRESPQAERLVLVVRTVRGVQGHSLTRSLERPAEWASPYGL